MTFRKWCFRFKGLTQSLVRTLWFISWSGFWNDRVWLEGNIFNCLLIIIRVRERCSIISYSQHYSLLMLYTPQKFKFMLVFFGSRLPPLVFLREIKIWEENWPAFLCPHVSSFGLSSETCIPVAYSCKIQAGRSGFNSSVPPFTGVETNKTVK